MSPHTSTWTSYGASTQRPGYIAKFWMCCTHCISVSSLADIRGRGGGEGAQHWINKLGTQAGCPTAIERIYCLYKLYIWYAGQMACWLMRHTVCQNSNGWPQAQREPQLCQCAECDVAEPSRLSRRFLLNSWLLVYYLCSVLLLLTRQLMLCTPKDIRV